MLSDTLYDAIQQIEFFQRECGVMYDDRMPQIELTKAVMQALVHSLDTPGTPAATTLHQVLSEEQLRFWRNTCINNITLWTDRLKMAESAEVSQPLRRRKNVESF